MRGIDEKENGFFNRFYYCVFYVLLGANNARFAVVRCFMDKYECDCGATFAKKGDAESHVNFFARVHSPDDLLRHFIVERKVTSRFSEFLSLPPMAKSLRTMGIWIIFSVFSYHFDFEFNFLELVIVAIGLGLII